MARRAIAYFVRPALAITSLSITSLAMTSLAMTSIAHAQTDSVEYGQYLAGECVACHRADGRDKGIPAIIGWPADQFVAVLQTYKDKQRPNAVMQAMTARLSTQDMAALAAYYASLVGAKE